jgi:hypothetical protein
MQVRRSAFLGLSAISGIAMFAATAGAAQDLGVRHRIDVIVSAEPDSSLLNKFAGARGSLSFTVRLSANSRETRYFGMLDRSFSDIVVSNSGLTPLVKQTTIWEEATCHQRRGLPKATVTRLEASFGQEGGRTEIQAATRHIGRPIPADELTPGLKLDAGQDDFGSFLAYRAQTRISRLNVDLKLYAIDCFP